jgi:hypothetical protein
VAIGASYRFRVRATDRAGNVGAWTYSPTFKPTKYDDATRAATWSAGWTRVGLSGSVGGYVRTTNATARTVTFSFTGLSVGFLAPRGPNMGFAQVYVDGVLTSTINLSAPTASVSRVVWAKSWSSSRAHTLRIRTLGTVGHPAVSVDAFVVLR